MEGLEGKWRTEGGRKSRKRKVVEYKKCGKDEKGWRGKMERRD